MPHPLLFGSLVLVVHLGLWFVSGWPGVGVWVAVIVLAVALVTIWSRRAAWTPRHVVAGWSAGLVAAAAGAAFAPAYVPTSTPLAIVSDVAVVVLAAALAAGAYRRARGQSEATSPATA